MEERKEIGKENEGIKEKKAWQNSITKWWNLGKNSVTEDKGKVVRE